MKMRLMAAVALLGGILLAMPALSGSRGAAAVRKQAESSLQVSGTITIGKDGSVIAHTLDPAAPLGATLTAFVDKAVAGWRFAPVMVDGQAVNARVPMHLRLVAKRAEGDAGEQHLQAADAEDRLAHQFQTRQGQFQADDEQHHHHADLAGGQYRLRVAHQPQRMRPQQRAGDQVAEHRAQPEALEHRHRDHRREQEHQCELEAVAVHVG